MNSTATEVFIRDPQSYLKARAAEYGEIAPELTGHGLPLIKCEAYNRVYEQPYESR